MKKKDQNWQVYIVLTNSGKLYTGITTDINKRFKKHLSKKGAKYFRIESPKEIVFTERHRNRSEATKREIEIKKLRKLDKVKLIRQVNSHYTSN